MNKFFLNFMPAILWISVVTTNLFGYLLDSQLGERWDLLIWIMITIAGVISSVCGSLKIKNLHNNSYTDNLTKLKNRNFFYVDMTNHMLKLKKKKQPISLLIIDIDKFKYFNDTYGHLMGDEILKQMSVLFLQNVRPQDTVVRWGGEEFTITLPNTNQQNAYIIAERIRKVVESNIFCYENVCSHITVSIGIATTDKEANIDSFIKTADKALYKAKEKRNLVVST